LYLTSKLITAALALVLVAWLAFLIVSTRQSGVSVRSVDKRLKIYTCQYFPGESVDFAYPPPPPQTSKLRIQWMLLAHKLKLYEGPRVQSPPPLGTIKGNGPALVVLGQIAGGESHWLELVTQNGETISQSAPMRVLVSDANLFLWTYAFYEGRKRRV